MRRLKTVVINGQNVTMNLRQCANKGCLRLFWAMRDSKQSICGELCWQVATQKNWLKKEDMPPVKKASKNYQKKYRMFSISSKSAKRPSDHDKIKKPRKAKSDKQGPEAEE